MAPPSLVTAKDAYMPAARVWIVPGLGVREGEGVALTVLLAVGLGVGEHCPAVAVVHVTVRDREDDTG